MFLKYQKNNLTVYNFFQTEQSAEEKRKQHQKELAEQLNNEARARLAEQKGVKTEAK